MSAPTQISRGPLPSPTADRANRAARNFPPETQRAARTIQSTA